MNKPWKVVLILAGIFLLGGISGAFVGMRVGRQWMLRHAAPEQWTPKRLKLLTERLDLTPGQVDQIRPIMHHNLEDIRRLRNESMANVGKIFERMEREISDKLTPEQRPKYEQMNREFRERARKFMQDRMNRPPGSGGPRGDHDRSGPGPDHPEGEPPPEKPPGV